jgi:hypothetical protein
MAQGFPRVLFPPKGLPLGKKLPKSLLIPSSSIPPRGLPLEI